MALGAVVANGGDGSARLRSVLAGERDIAKSERGERRGKRGHLRGAVGSAETPRGGKQELARLGCASGTQLLLLLAGGRRQCCPWWAGPASCSTGPVGGSRVSLAR